jgi:hypothetical protein
MDLKQAPCAWYSRIDGYLLGLGFTKSEVDSNLYYVLVEGVIHSSWYCMLMISS